MFVSLDPIESGPRMVSEQSKIGAQIGSQNGPRWVPERSLKVPDRVPNGSRWTGFNRVEGVENLENFENLTPPRPPPREFFRIFTKICLKFRPKLAKSTKIGSNFSVFGHFFH